jgi:hypothetical protein
MRRISVLGAAVTGFSAALAAPTRRRAAATTRSLIGANGRSVTAKMGL